MNHAGNSVDNVVGPWINSSVTPPRSRRIGVVAVIVVTSSIVYDGVTAGCEVAANVVVELRLV